MATHKMFMSLAVLAAMAACAPASAQQQSYTGPTWTSRSFYDNGAWYIEVTSADTRFLYCRAPWAAIRTGLSLYGGGTPTRGNAEINVAPRSSNSVYFTNLGNFRYEIECRER